MKGKKVPDRCPSLESHLCYTENLYMMQKDQHWLLQVYVLKARKLKYVEKSLNNVKLLDMKSELNTYETI